jgi:hypothetical protein
MRHGFINAQTIKYRHIYKEIGKTSYTILSRIIFSYFDSSEDEILLISDLHEGHFQLQFLTTD